MPATKFFKGLTLGRAKTSLLLGTALALTGLAFSVSQLLADPKPVDLSESPFALTTMEGWRCDCICSSFRAMQSG